MEYPQKYLPVGTIFLRIRAYFYSWITPEIDEAFCWSVVYKTATLLALAEWYKILQQVLSICNKQYQKSYIKTLIFLKLQLAKV